MMMRMELPADIVGGGVLVTAPQHCSIDASSFSAFGRGGSSAVSSATAVTAMNTTQGFPGAFERHCETGATRNVVVPFLLRFERCNSTKIRCDDQGQPIDRCRWHLRVLFARLVGPRSRVRIVFDLVTVPREVLARAHG
jgi:hypothetical protein